MKNTYKLLDCGNFSKLEQVGPYNFVRPSPGAVWQPSLPVKEWSNVDATFIRKSDGKGFWKVLNKNMQEKWNITVGPIDLAIQRTNFGHLGVFVEQKDNWVEFIQLIKPKAKLGEYKVLNLFAYTGAASLACAKAGAVVTHVDASKTSNAWARDNARLNGLEQAAIRWITDDVKVFVEREIRRKNKYQAIILDPPSFGRGSKNQIWKIESDMVPLLTSLEKLMSDDFHFISLSSHSPGYSPISLQNLLQPLCKGRNGEYRHREMTVAFKDQLLPAGITCLAECK